VGRGGGVASIALVDFCEMAHVAKRIVEITTLLHTRFKF